MIMAKKNAGARDKVGDLRRQIDDLGGSAGLLGDDVALARWLRSSSASR